MIISSENAALLISALDKYFLSPSIAIELAQSLISPLNLRSATMIGAPDTPIALLQSDSAAVLVGDALVIAGSPFARELAATDSLERVVIGQRELAIYVVPSNERTAQRLKVPRVLLVNLFHREMYPTPRLTLGIAYIASHLRERHVAEVTLRDFQFPISVQSLLDEIAETRYEIVGLSVNFGQLDILEKLLSGIASRMTPPERPTVALGNILPAMSAAAIIEQFSDVIVCQRDGELMMEMLAREFRDRSKWHRVPGAVFRDHETGKIVRTAPQLVNLDELPPPALDLAEETLRNGGVITAEFSRGCHYNVCSFCPRSHKASSWRGMQAPGFGRHLNAYLSLFEAARATPYIFLADEEFIGAEAEGFSEHGRIRQFLQVMNGLPGRMRFDAATRADQAFSAVQNEEWHRQRGLMFEKLKDAGLSRLFIGVESGSDGQLRRYNKGTDVSTNVSSLRYLSMLGIKLRFGFITFDPLMSAEELCEDIEFMARRDVVLPENDLEVSKIFEIVRESHDQRVPGRPGRPVFEEVSYVASPLEVLLKSRYLAETRAAALDLVAATDVGFARVEVKYRDPLIYLTSELCQRWINHCFPVVYTLKGLQKTAEAGNAVTLSSAISLYRGATFFLLRSLVSAFGLAGSRRAEQWEAQEASPITINVAKINAPHSKIGEEILEAYSEHFREELEGLDKSLRSSGLKSDVWERTYLVWREQKATAMAGVRQR